ncbi:ornithine cyclodeaminase family protein (plasmid) [Paracoccus pantotrophus]|uniref:Ornithine cyclodeaminase family protein n=1 Tax=Paracoccus pantotrophus TaxID=82367 RepID=A0A7H9C0Z6_PARPN|nr:iminosuccinate reductase BhcD [Paracoccus pantotrophus]QLH17049.1 ornithine cyclodeaminase family protein [Paracoccus pantotrophus]
MWIVPEKEIAGLMTPEAAFDAVQAVFAAMASGKASNFPVVREAIGHEDALYGFKGGFDRSARNLGLKAGGYWPNNQRRELINHQSTVFLFDADTGRVQAAVGGNLLTALRTAAASAVSIKYLARPDAKVLGIVGAGHQSTYQLRAALDQRPFEKVLAWNRTPERLKRLEAAAQEKGLPFKSVTLEQLCQQADVVVTITSSFSPMIAEGLIRPGTHLACMGTDTRGKQEVAPEIVAASTVFTDEVAQSTTIGEAQHAFGMGLLDAAAIVPIGDVINKEHPGRRSAEEITLFDGTGIGIQDLAVASAAVDLAVARGRAVEVEM